MAWQQIEIDIIKVSFVMFSRTNEWLVLKKIYVLLRYKISCYRIDVDTFDTMWRVVCLCVDIRPKDEDWGEGGSKLNWSKLRRFFSRIFMLRKWDVKFSKYFKFYSRWIEEQSTNIFETIWTFSQDDLWKGKVSQVLKMTLIRITKYQTLKRVGSIKDWMVFQKWHKIKYFLKNYSK